MSSIRRAYVLITCALSLQAATWAAIFLLRGLLDPETRFSANDLAFQIAVLVVLVPIYLAHWRWAGRLAASSPGEQGAGGRRFYLLAMDALFVLGIVAFAQMLLRTVLRPLAGAEGPLLGDLVRAVSALLVLTVVLRYNRGILRRDLDATGETGPAPAFRRLHRLGLAAIGLILGAQAAIGLLRILLSSFGGAAATVALSRLNLADLAASALVGTATWVWFWNEAQAGFATRSRDEERSALRKLYLYGVVLVTALTTVLQAALILAGVFRLALGLEMQGDLRDPLTVILVNALIWAYHHRVLASDAAAAPEAPRQAGIRRLYDYLVAAVGLAAFGAGLAGLVSVLIRMLGSASITDAQREILAWSAAGVLAGLPIWVLPWRRAQNEALAEGEPGESARAALPRKAYLYLYLLITTVSLIISSVYVIFRLVSFALGELDPENNLGLDLAQALALAAIAGGAWIYHFRILRADGDLDDRAARARLAQMPTLVVDASDGHLGHRILAALSKGLEGLPVAAIGLTPGARDRLGASGADDSEPAAAISTEDALMAIEDAEILVLPWMALEAGGDTPELARAIAASPARKLLLPTRDEGVEWAGVDRWEEAELVEQVVAGVAQLASGAKVEPKRPLGAGNMVLVGIGGLILLAAIGIPLAALISQLF